MRILHVNWTGQHGGTENFTCQLAVQQLRAGLTPLVCYLTQGGPFGKRLARAQIPVFELRAKGGWDVRALYQLSRLIGREKIALVHNHNGPLGYVAALFHPRVALLVHAHGTPIGPGRWQPWRRLTADRLLRKRVYRFIANSYHTAGILAEQIGHAPRQIEVIPCAIDLEAFVPTRSREQIRRELGVEPDRFVLGTVARLHKQKGIDSFLRIAARIHAEVPAIRFLIVGDGPERAALHELARSLGVSEAVSFLGGRDDIPDVLTAFDLFAMTSRWEPFGITVLEAMACAVPVVAFAVDGVVDIISDDCALLAPPCDIERFAERVLAVQGKREDPAPLVARANQIVGKFDIRSVERDLSRLYRQALAQSMHGSTPVV